MSTPAPSRTTATTAADSSPSAGAPVEVRVWDLPTRLFHWSLALCVTGSVLTAWEGGLAMDWHARFGYAVLILLLFRLAWGFIGGYWSRLSRLLFGPGTLWRYLRGRARDDEHLDVGHSPLGALSVLAMLLALGLQVASGLFASDDIFFSGPLSHHATSDWVASLSRYHKDVGQWLVIGLVSLHLLAILSYPFIRDRQIIPSMVDGDKTAAPGAPASRDTTGTALLAAGVLAGCALLVYLLVTLGQPAF